MKSLTKKAYFYWTIFLVVLVSLSILSFTAWRASKDWQQYRYQLELDKEQMQLDNARKQLELQMQEFKIQATQE